MSFTEILAPGTAIADGQTVDQSEGRLKLIFQVSGAALTAAETIIIHVQNNAGNWLPFLTLSATVQRVETTGRGIFRAERTALLTTSSGCEYDAVPVS